LIRSNWDRRIPICSWLLKTFEFKRHILRSQFTQQGIIPHTIQSFLYQSRVKRDSWSGRVTSRQVFFNFSQVYFYIFIICKWFNFFSRWSLIHEKVKKYFKQNFILIHPKKHLKIFQFYSKKRVLIPSTVGRVIWKKIVCLRWAGGICVRSKVKKTSP